MGVRMENFTFITLVPKFLLEKPKPLLIGHFAKSLAEDCTNFFLFNNPQIG